MMKRSHTPTTHPLTHSLVIDHGTTR